MPTTNDELRVGFAALRAEFADRDRALNERLAQEAEKRRAEAAERDRALDERLAQIAAEGERRRAEAERDRIEAERRRAEDERRHAEAAERRHAEDKKRQAEAAERDRALNERLAQIAAKGEQDRIESEKRHAQTEKNNLKNTIFVMGAGIAFLAFLMTFFEFRDPAPAPAAYYTPPASSQLASN